MSAQEPCVYVKEAVLSQLEREKRGLKWQLARTTKLADARAADVAACEAKVKDLLTIVEMNKSVADRAVKRTYSQEATLQRVARERDALQAQVLQQRQHFLEHGLRGLQQRAQRRLQRTALHALASQAKWHRHVRMRLKRVAVLCARVRAALALWQWKRVCCTLRAASVQPLPSPASAARAIVAATAAKTQAFATSSLSSTPRRSSEFLFDERFRLRFERRRERTRVSFFAWKADWTLAKKQQHVARRWFEARLVRCVLHAWRRRVRLTQQRSAALELAKRSTMQRIMCAWAVLAQRRTQQLSRLRHLVRTHRRTLLQQSFTRLRVRCIERGAIEWTRALQSAHAALEEEKVAYALHQDAALRELHESYATHEQQKRMRVAHHTRQLARLKCEQHLRRHFSAWHAQLTSQRLQSQVAAQVHRVQHRTRVRRRHFVAWQRLTAAHVRVRHWRTDAQRRRDRALVARVVCSWRALARCEQAKARRLRALASRITHVRLLQSWSRWREALVLDEMHANALLETRERTEQRHHEHLEWQRERARSDKVQRRLQLQCALLRRTAVSVRHMQRHYRAWARHTKTQRRRRAALARVLNACVSRLREWSLTRWRQRVQQLVAWDQALQARAEARPRRQQHAALAQWRCFTRARVQLRWSLQRKCVYFALWRDAQALRRTRALALRCLLARRVAQSWQRLAFRRWQRHTTLLACRDHRRARIRSDSLVRTWRAWQTFVTRQLRHRCRQRAAIEAHARVQQQQTVMRSAWHRWRLLVQRRRWLRTRCSGARAHRQIRQQAFAAWRLWTTTARQQRTLLTRVLRRARVRAKRAAWTRWMTIAAQARAVETLRDGSLARVTSITRRTTVRRTLERTLKRWRAWLRTARSYRHTLQRFRARRQTLALAQCLRAWRRDFMRARAVLRQLVRRRLVAMHRAVLARAFKRWEHTLALQTLALQSTLHQVLLDNAHERGLELVRQAFADKSLRAVVAAWRQHTLRYRTLRSVLRRMTSSKTSRLQRLAWTQWRACVAHYERLRRAVALLSKQQMTTAWRTLQHNRQRWQCRMRAAQTIYKLLQRRCLRIEWRTWLRQDRRAAQALVEQTMQRQSKSLVRATVLAHARRRLARRCERRVFTTWKQLVVAQTRARAVWRQVTSHCDATRCATSFQRWCAFVALCRTRKTLLKRICTRQVQTAVCSALHRWKLQSLSAAHSAALARTQHELQRRRTDNATRVASALYMAWKRSCLAACFASWSTHTHALQRQRSTMLEQCMRRRTSRQTALVLHAWRKYVHSKHVGTQRCQRAVAQYNAKLTTTALRLWHATVHRKRTFVVVLTNVVDILRTARLRTAFQHLAHQQREQQRRESMLLVLSAQHALVQQQQELVRQRVGALLAHKQSKTQRGVFARWRTAVAAVKQRRAFVRITRRRFALRTLRRALTCWRSTVVRSRTLQRRVAKLHVTQQQRWLRTLWRHWRVFATYSQRTKRLVYDCMVTQRAQSAVQQAWSTWRRVVWQASIEIAHQRAAVSANAATEQQRVLETLETRNEALLLESVALKKHVRTMRQQTLIAFCQRLARVLVTRSVARAFTTWRQCARAMSLLQSLLASLAHHSRAGAFYSWRNATYELRATAERTQQRKATVEKVLLVFTSANVQTKKRSVLLRWRALAQTQRSTRARTRLLQLLAQSSTDRIVVRCCWTSWCAFVTRKREARLLVRAMRLRHEQRLLQRSYLLWHRSNLAARRTRRLFAHIARAWRQRQLARSWQRWTRYSLDTVVTIAHAKLVMLELEHWNASCRHALEQLLARTFATWKRVVSTMRACRQAQVTVVQELQVVRRQRACFAAWRDLLPARQRLLRPVLCIQTSVRRSSASDRVLYCSYREYRRKHQTRWRLSTTKRLLHKHVVRTYALSLLLRALRRQHWSVQRRAFWIWFATIQRISPTLATLSFRALPWRMVQTNYAGSMLLLVLEEMHHLQQASALEHRVTSWHILAQIVKRIERQQLQRAFDRLAFAALVIPRKQRRRTPTAFTPLASRTHTAAVRAGAHVLAAVHMRRAFCEWKTQYIAAALAQAEAAQTELLDALRTVASYRQTLDPYAVPY